RVTQGVGQGPRRGSDTSPTKPSQDEMVDDFGSQLTTPRADYQPVSGLVGTDPLASGSQVAVDNVDHLGRERHRSGHAPLAGDRKLGVLGSRPPYIADPDVDDLGHPEAGSHEEGTEDLLE